MENEGVLMTETKKRRSTLLLLYELLRDVIVFIDLELQLAIAEVRRNVGSAKRGVIQMTVGLFLLLLALLLMICSAVSALAIVLPLWLASLIVGALFAASGLWFLLTGKNRLNKASPFPNESIERIRAVSRKLKG
ncbi:MAG: phage holin family protein [Deltaproteobacteria bacterium]|nr:phage holin family protein [Deltaproteobacteria bacterium]